MKEVSVLTAVGPNPNPEFLLAAAASLSTGQEGVVWEWVLYGDGPAADTTQHIPLEIQNLPNVVVAESGLHSGTAAARNLGLLACRYPYIMNLDADDMVLPGALAALAAGLTEYPQAAFAFGHEFRYLPGGVITEWGGALVQAGHANPDHSAAYAPGLVGIKQTIEMWWQTGRHHVTLASAMWRREELLARLYPAMQIREDQMLLFEVNWTKPGVCIAEATLHHRIHEGQSTRQVQAQQIDPAYQKMIAFSLLARRLSEGDTPAPDDWYVPDESGVKIAIPPLET